MTSPVRITHADPNRKRYVLAKDDTVCCSSNLNCKSDESKCCDTTNQKSDNLHHIHDDNNDDKNNSSLLIPIKKTGGTNTTSRILNAVPEDIRNDPSLNEAISVLPSNYNFEIQKSIWHVRKLAAKKVALQMPEGFQRYALVLTDIHKRFGGCEEVVILGDVAYGACCIDDYTARSLNCDLIIHYGHSCLIPVTTTLIPVLYIFVEIAFDCNRLVNLIKDNFNGKKVAIMATVQYIGALHNAKREIDQSIVNLFIPQIKPLSPGEVLGCTSPRLPVDTDALVFVADGRFHLEAAMIANPTIPAFRYDPFTFRMFQEGYDHERMLTTRKMMIDHAKGANHFGVILGTLGRQGSPAVMDDLVRKLKNVGKTVTTFMMSEVRPEKLAKFPFIDAWVQTSCPRLSIDWNYAFKEPKLQSDKNDQDQDHTSSKPLLTPYELNVMLGEIKAFTGEIDGTYPMDFYATGDAALASGPWTPGYHLRPPKRKI